jgi:hypothetical protein
VLNGTSHSGEAKLGISAFLPRVFLECRGAHEKTDERDDPEGSERIGKTVPPALFSVDLGFEPARLRPREVRFAHVGEVGRASEEKLLVSVDIEESGLAWSAISRRCARDVEKLVKLHVSPLETDDGEAHRLRETMQEENEGGNAVGVRLLEREAHHET